MSKPLRLFEAYGIELEYMIVDRDTLEVRPISDELLRSMSGTNSDFENGMVTWSNELVLHVIELKCTEPESDLDQLEEAFRINIRQINDRLKQWNAMLLPTAAHPFMNPQRDTKLWPHDNNEIYAIYNKIFDCRGHGWSNLQSTHLNLPFNGDEEFARLHAACRVILPILPAICASSPVLDSRFTSSLDGRMTFYKENQKEIPSITGLIVPEAVWSSKEYEEVIYRKIAADIAPYNDSDILDPVWVNSRGAMARFDRGSIEIRVMDIQECPAMDIAIQSFVIGVLRELVHESWSTLTAQKNMGTDVLARMLDETIEAGMASEVTNREWLALFGINKMTCNMHEVVAHLYGRLITTESGPFQGWNRQIKILLDEGNLSSRIIRSLNRDTSDEAIQQVWRKLAACLQNNEVFIP